MTIFSKSENETIQSGKRFAKDLQSGHIIALIGELGSGKTAFTRGICRAFGCEDQISSPTFTIINAYEGSVVLFHVDTYRLEKKDSEKIRGIYDLMNEKNCIVIIEWAERLCNPLPPHWQVQFSIDSQNMNRRKIQIDWLEK